MSKRFRVGFTFAGEKRAFVAEVAENLAQQFGREDILYDKYHEAEFARADLAFHLPKLYGKEVELVVGVFCQEYNAKEWTGLEWKSIYGLLIQNNNSTVLLSRYDHAEPEGLYGLSGFIELDNRTPEQFADLIRERLAINEGKSREFYKPSKVVPPKESPLSPIASKVLNEIGQTAINNGCEIITDNSARKHLSDLSDDLYQESLEILESERLIKIHSLAGSAGPYVTITSLGFELYGKLFIADYAGLVTKIECALVNNEIESNHKLAEFVAKDQFVVDQILELMSDNKLVKLARHSGGHAWIMEVSSEIRRKYA